MKALTVLLSVVPGIGCYLGLIDGGYGVIEEIKTPAAAGAFAPVAGIVMMHRPRLDRSQ